MTTLEIFGYIGLAYTILLAFNVFLRAIVAGLKQAPPSEALARAVEILDGIVYWVEVASFALGAIRGARK